MRRALFRFTAALLIALAPSLLGGMAALLYTESGQRVLGRLTSETLSARFRGDFTVRRVGGSFFRSLVLDSVTIRDTLGQPFASVARLSVRYAPGNLLAGRFVFQSARLESPTVRIIKRANGRLNFHEIFRLGEARGTGRSPLVEFRGISIEGGAFELWLPWAPPDTARSPAMAAQALAAERARPGRVIVETPDGLRRIVRFDGLDGSLSRLLVSSPDGTPLTFDVASLATRVSDPAVTIRDLVLHGWTHQDTLAFTLRRGQLPASRFSGKGVITWPNGPLRYDFALEAPAFDLGDLRWISPDFPPMAGHATVTAHSRSDQQTAYTLRRMDLAGAPGRLTGAVTVVLDARRGLGVEGMDLALEALDLDVPRPYLDTIPFQGTLTGRLAGSGYLDGLDVTSDVVFSDRAVGGATSHVVASGHLRFPRGEGAVFDSVTLAPADIDLATVRRVTPAVELLGRLVLDGTLDGAWRDVTFVGEVRHRDGEYPESVADGTVRLDTRGATTRFRTDVLVAPLAFDGVRPSYPAIPVLGRVNGRIALDGSADRFRMSTAIDGDLGRLEAEGGIAWSPGRLETNALTATFEGLDLHALRGMGPHTSLAGALHVDGVQDSLTGPEGSLTVALGPGRVEELPLDSLELAVRAHEGGVEVDTFLVRWPAGRMGGSGGLGWRADAGGGIHSTFSADSLAAFEPFLSRLAGPPADSAAAASLEGRVAGVLELRGTSVTPQVTLWVRTDDVRWREYRVPTLEAGLGWRGTKRPELGLSVRADTVFVGDWSASSLLMAAGGPQDSLRWLGATRVRDAGNVVVGGVWRSSEGGVAVDLDSLVLTLPRHAWALEHPGVVTVGEERIDVSPLVLAAGDGAGVIRLGGSVPRRGEGRLDVSVLGLELRDVYALLERDTSTVAGTLQLELAVGGTAASPTLRGAGSVADLAYGNLGSPFVQGVFDYTARRLDANLLLWKTGQPVLRLEAMLPMDLALQSVPARRVEGPLRIRAVADSTELGVAEAFTRNLRQVRGRLEADVEIAGTWAAPLLGGRFRVRDASARVPGLGVHYQGLQASAHLSGDSIVIDTLSVQSGSGELRAAGVIHLERLERPVLDLRFNARRFRAIDVQRFLTLDASGQFTLAGPVFNAHLGGRITADEGDLHFADLITKRIVDLENPGDSGLIDLDLLRAERLGANFQSRLLDSLHIDGLQVRMGQSFWLRSNEAAIQLDGAVTINKVRDQYRSDGTLTALRGKYTLRIAGVVSRDFTVEKGTVRYFGTPDLDAELDIEAKHTVVAVETQEEIEVIARITGTMLRPKLELTSTPAAQRVPLSQTELVSYLMFGRPTFSQQGGGTSSTQANQNLAVQAGLSYLSGALTSELQQALVSDLGVPIDFLDIRPGGAAGGASYSAQGGSSQVAVISAGWHLGRRWFVTVVADLCTNQQRFYPNVEYRMTRELRLKTAVEPSYSCQTTVNQPTLTGTKYQVGLDLLWKRDY